MCNSCKALTINGVYCHETGCPDAWKEKKIECKECGYEFVPEENGQQFCSEHCACMYSGSNCTCDGCDFCMDCGERTKDCICDEEEIEEDDEE